MISSSCLAGTMSRRADLHRASIVRRERAPKSPRNGHAGLEAFLRLDEAKEGFVEILAPRSRANLLWRGDPPPRYRREAGTGSRSDTGADREPRTELKRQAHSYTRHQAVSRLIRDNLELNRFDWRS
jgi:hypothetical protein